MEAQKAPRFTLHQLLFFFIDRGSSEIYITTNSPPQLRIDGKLHPLRMPPLTPQETKQLCYSVLTDAQKHQFDRADCKLFGKYFWVRCLVHVFV